MNHEQLMRLTESLPMKTIMVNDQPYLERYYVATLPDGTQDWLHRFLRDDAERHLHTHPFHAESTILCGWYLEDRGDRSVYWSEGDINRIHPETLHRIKEVAPNTWTHMCVKPGREPYWHFIEPDGTKVAMKSAPENWWTRHGVRGELKPRKDPQQNARTTLKHKDKKREAKKTGKLTQEKTQ